MNEQMNPFQSFFTTTDLRNCLKQLSSTISKSEKQVEPDTSKLKFQCFVKNEKYDCLAGANLRKQILYAFANNSNCQIKILVFQKSNGYRNQLSLKKIGGVVTSMSFIIYQDPGLKEKKVYKLLIGFKDGFLKVIDLSDVSINGRRMDVKPIVSIIIGDYIKFHQQNVCILLAEDNYIYFVDSKSLQIIYILKPNLITCDKALSIQIDCQFSYLMQTTQGGYIVFWKMSQILNHFKQISNNKADKGPINKYNVLPIRVNHSIAIDGLIGCYFYGHTIVVINKNGLLRIIVINVRMEEQFIVLSQYQIQNPQNISCARVYAQQDCILISKSRGNKHPYVQKLIMNEQFYICKRIIINFPQLDSINQFYLPPEQSILMCRGQNCYGIGYHHELFESGKYSKYSNEKKMDIQDY